MIRNIGIQPAGDIVINSAMCFFPARLVLPPGPSASKHHHPMAAACRSKIASCQRHRYCTILLRVMYSYRQWSLAIAIPRLALKLWETWKCRTVEWRTENARQKSGQVSRGTECMRTGNARLETAGPGQWMNDYLRMDALLQECTRNAGQWRIHGFRNNRIRGRYGKCGSVIMTAVQGQSP